jgi:hypothetical protein
LLLVKEHRGRKRLVAILGLLIGLTIGCAYSKAEQFPDWMQPGVRVGGDRFDKHPFPSVGNIGTVTDIRSGELRSPGKVELGVAGNYGAKFFDRHGNLDASVDFAVREPEEFRVSANIISQSGSHGLLFFRHAAPAATYDSLVDATGREIWRTPYSPIASTFGDLKKDGVPEFVFVGQDTAIEARDVSGGVIWRKQKFGWAYKAVVINPQIDPRPELLADVTGTLFGLGTGGEILFERKPAIDFFFSDFSVLRWPTVCDGECLLISGSDKILLLTPDGEKLVTELRPADYAMAARGISVRFYESEPPLLAVAGSLPFKGGQWAGYKAVHGALYIFDSRRNLVYQEVLSDPVEALSVLPAADGKTETLLVGGENKVWQYSAPQRNTSPSPLRSN